jgi:uncharacterized protein RhaS with RHS repeats
MRNRYYDPMTGKFTQVDPIGLGGGLNLYGFAQGDPVNFSDPFGLCTPMPGCLLGWQGLQHALGLDGIPFSTPNRPSRLSAGVSGSLGLASGGCSVGASSGCGPSVNVTPQYGASFDLGIKVRSADPGEPVVGVSAGVNEHLGVTVSNEGVTISIGVGVGSPVNANYTPNPQSTAGATGPIPQVKPDQTRVVRKLDDQSR